MQTPNPEMTGRPSSVARREAASGTAPEGTSPLADSLPQPDAENAPTIITQNRLRPTDPVLAENIKGKKLGHFELIEPIGVGGMAAVIRAHDMQLGRTVALKILPPEMAVDPENIARFKNEARAAAKLDHENIARVFYCGEDQGLHFIAFEFVDGTDLRAMFARNGPLTPAQAVRFMLQVATGLAHAAERGVIHRDIKPSNIIITPEGRAKIVDMGLARQVNAVGGVTQSGMTLGTFDYVSPEQAIEPRSADVRSDIYSLGCSFYHLLTGEPPVPEGTAAKKLHHHQHVAPTDPRDLNPSIPDELAAILGRMMAKEPRDRYQRPEHLVQHLIQLAQKLNLGEGSGVETVLFMDAPLPQPPRFSPWVAGAFAVAAVAVLAAVLGVIGTHRDQGGRILPWSGDDEGAAPPWLANSPNANGTTEAKNEPAPPPLAPAEPRTAATVQELARWIEQKAEHIRLTGTVYDLTELYSENQAKPLGLRVTSRRIKVEGAGSRPAIIRWGGLPGAARNPDPLAAFQLAATDPDASAEFVNVRFECHSTEDDAPIYAVVARGLSQLSFRKCEFFHDRQADTPAGGAIKFDERPDKPSLLTLEECLFGRGPSAVEFTDRSSIRATQCAFGPHDAMFRIRPTAVRTMPNADWELTDLRYCTFMVRNGAVFHLEKGSSGTLRAGWCLFGRASDSGDNEEPVLVRQKDAKDAIAFAGVENEVLPRNVFHNLTLWDSAGKRATRLAEARKQFGFADTGAIEMVQRPWRSPEPHLLIDDRPQEAFSLVTTLNTLRTQPRSVRMLGAQRGTWGETYMAALKPLPEDTVEATFTRRIVNPTWSIETPLPPMTYRSLESAIGEAKPGDTIVLQSNGPIEVQPLRWSRTDDRPLVLRPDDGYKPVLVLHSDTAEPAAALFTVAGGRIDFRDLHFRLHSDAKKERDRLAAVALSGAGHATFTHCAFTLDDSEGCHLAVAHIVGDADPASRAADRRPRVRFESCFVRGKGDLIDVRPSRRFDLEAENSLIALDGTLVSIHANPKEVPPLAGSIAFNRVTGYVNDFWLDLRLSDEERKAGGGLAATQCKVERSLLVAGNAKALVHAVGIDSDTLQRQYLTFEGRGNVYANFVQMVEVELPASTMMMPTMPVSPKTWRTLTREGEDAFIDVKLIRPPTSDRPLARMQPDDFRVKPLDMKKMEAPGDTGANLVDLPAADE